MDKCSRQAERERVIAIDGQLHMGNIAPATRDMLPRMPLRDGWRDVFHTLAFKVLLVSQALLEILTSSDFFTIKLVLILYHIGSSHICIF